MQDFSSLADSAEKATSLLKLLANKNRLMILCSLIDGELSVKELNERIPIAQSSLSQQLAWLRNAQLVKTRREAQSIFYSLDSPEAEKIILSLYQIYCA
ncbi:MAG: winged helix-turn-helix transcriptional regulator [Oceanospirillaceae bacterium]|nr:winged helix-turn-helix transcriptional regulator [Oceanospirillaceae bacterium]